MSVRSVVREAAGRALPGERRVLEAAQQALRGEARGLRALLPFLGPAFVAAVAYVDPGNFATNVTSGSAYGYTLLWVVLLANLIAMLVQAMSAKLGIATGRNLAEVCRARAPRGLNVVLWLQAEVVAMATDLAEFVGAALGLNLVFGIPLFVAALIVGVATFGILGLQSRGFRSLEAVIAGLVGAIVAAFAFEVVLARPSPPGLAAGLVPHFAGGPSVVAATGILGATVMPHVVYLHSALTQHRVVPAGSRDRRRIYRFELWDIVIAMGIAGLINLAMLATAAAVFSGGGSAPVQDLTVAARGLGERLGHHAGLFFGMGLLASGLSSSSVGTMAGQVVMQGFVQRRIPVLVRRVVTMLPALAVVGIGVNATQALVFSQVVLSFGIPFALLPLLLFCRDRQLMGDLANRGLTTAVAAVAVAAIVLLNALLVGQLAGLSFPG